MTNLKQKRFVDTDYLKEQLDSTAIEVEGSYITATETKIGAIQDLEILGNTVQDPNNLADIKSVGELQEDGTYKMSILSCGKNLFDGNEFSPRAEINQYSYTNGILTMSCDSQPHRRIDYILPNTLVHGKRYILTANVKALEYSSNFTPGQYFGYGYYNNGSETYFGDFDTSSNIMTLNFIYKEQGDKSIGFHNDSKDGVTKLQWSNIQLEEGTVATEYEPYQENKCDILLPCQLEKVGDVSDRLYYDDVEKAWCIEKNIYTVSEFKRDTGDTSLWRVDKTIKPLWKRKPTWNIISNMIMCNFYEEVDTYDTLLTKPGIFIDHIGTNYNIIINTNDDNISELPSNCIVKYQLETPQKIVLPLSTQIQLNSFFGTTHIYMESGEVEGTIKCKIPKSLGATVQSLNNKTDILSDRIKAIEGLKDSQNMKYETNKGYLVCQETKNGVIDDLKIEGKTLVNLCQFKDTQFTLTTGEHYNDLFICYTDNLKLNTNYTFMYDIEITSNTTSAVLGTNIINQFGVSSSDIEDTTNHPSMKINGTTTVVMSQLKNHNRALIQFIDFKGYKALRLRPVMPPIRPLPQGESIQYKVKNMILLEGDYTQNPPSYFEGLMSVGQDVDEISVESVNENLVPSDWDYKFQCFGDMKVNQIDTRTFEIVNTNTVDGIVISKNFINKFCYNNKVVFDFYSNQIGHFYVLDYGVSGEGYKPVQGVMFIEGGRNVFVVDVSNASGRLAFRFNNNTKNSTMIISDFSIKTSKNSNNVNHQSDKKQILFYNENGELEPIQELHEWDSIEKHNNNKWYYHKRSGKVVLNGSEDWEDYDENSFVNRQFFKDAIGNTTDTDTNKAICNRFVFGKVLVDTNRWQYYNHLQNVWSMFAKKTGQTLEQFKSELQANNVTVVYQLAREEVYECIDLGVNSYEGETLVQVNSGVICPQNLAFSTQKHIGNIVNKLQERVDKNTKFREELTENMTYTETIEQGKGYTVIENSKEGVVTVPEIEGKTLVSIHYKKTYTKNMVNLYNWFYATNGFKVEIGKTYTIFANINNLVDVKYKSSNNMIFSGLGNTNKIKTFIAKENDELVFVNLVTGQYSMSDLMILEGDYTQNPPSYFEGLKSVGDETDEIVVSSVNKNLFDKTQKLVDGYVSEQPETYGDVVSHNTCKSTDFILIEPNTTYTFNNDNPVEETCGFYDTNKKCITVVRGNTVTSPSNAKYMRCTIKRSDFEQGFQIVRGTQTIEYTPYQSDKKQLLFYNNETQTWEKPILREWDSIEKHSDGKYYYHQRSGEVVLNGSENWNNNNTTDNYISFYISTPFTRNQLVKCDKFTSVIWIGSASGEFIWSFTASCGISIAKSKLSSQDVAGFKQWLQANNVTVVYQLAEEKVYECTNIELNSYDGETNVIVESGAIVPQTTVKVQNNLQEIIRNLKNRVRQLEEDIYNYKVNQNLRQLRTFYKSDYANFGVATLNNYSIEPTSIAITPYGYDLFEIFKEVIAQGKDKYDRIELEEYIDFYLMTFVFDFDMVFELFDLLDANEDIIEDEPVEEEPPKEEEEDVVEDTPTILPNLPEDEATPIPLI